MQSIEALSLRNICILNFDHVNSQRNPFLRKLTNEMTRLLWVRLTGRMCFGSSNSMSMSRLRYNNVSGRPQSCGAIWVVGQVA